MTIYTLDSEKQKDKNIKKLTWFLRNTELYSNWEITKIKVFKKISDKWIKGYIKSVFDNYKKKSNLLITITIWRSFPKKY